MCEIHTIENIRLVPCDRIRPITLLSDIPHPDMWGDARSQQKSETVAITYNRHRCKRHFIILFPCSWLHENFPTTRKREITSLLGLSLGDATSQAMGAKSCLRLFWELSTNSRTATHFWSVTGRIVHGGLNYMNDDDNQRPATHLNCGYAFLVSLLTPNDCVFQFHHAVSSQKKLAFGSIHDRSSHCLCSLAKTVTVAWPW